MQESRQCTDVVVYSHTSPFSDHLREPERIFTCMGQTVRIQQGWQPGGHGGTEIGFGASVYDSAIVLSNYIENMHHEFRNKVIVELGCGPGMVSVVSSLAGAGRVIATDGDDGSVQLTSTNISLNCKEENIEALKLRWGDQNHVQNVREAILRFNSAHGSKRNKPDFIVASDVAACPYADSYRDLISTIRDLCDADTTVLLTYQRRHASENTFFENLETICDIERMKRTLIHKDFRHLPIFLFKANLKRTENM